MNYNVPVFTLSGAVGPGVTAGNDRHIIWNAAADWPGQFSSQCKVKIIADDGALAPGTALPSTAGLVLIPPGPFQMGDISADGNIAERPVHTVYVSGFYMDQFEVSYELWRSVRTAALTVLDRTYSLGAGSSKADNHPVQSISWYDAVIWCNARSEKEGLTPCYYTDATQTTIYRTGSLNLTNGCVKWTANGYRLPTEVEWEKAARGGLTGKRFPWGDTITHSNANYNSSTGFAYGVSTTRNYHPSYGTGSQPFTSPVGSFPPNSYGLYDMAGNVWEWCWDWYDADWYPRAGATADNPRGPAIVLNYRVLRGGQWQGLANFARCADRYFYFPVNAYDTVGFRCVRGLTF